MTAVGAPFYAMYVALPKIMVSFSTNVEHMQWVISAFAIAAPALLAFVAFELPTKKPFVDLRLFKIFSFSTASVVRFLHSTGLNTYAFLVGLVVQQTLGCPPLQAGLMMPPGAVVMGVAGLLVGRLADAEELRVILAVGLVSLALVGYVVSLVTPLDRRPVGPGVGLDAHEQRVYLSTVERGRPAHIPRSARRHGLRGAARRHGDRCCGGHGRYSPRSSGTGHISTARWLPSSRCFYGSHCCIQRRSSRHS